MAKRGRPRSLPDSSDDPGVMLGSVMVPKSMRDAIVAMQQTPMGEISLGAVVRHLLKKALTTK